VTLAYARARASVLGELVQLARAVERHGRHRRARGLVLERVARCLAAVRVVLEAEGVE